MGKAPCPKCLGKKFIKDKENPNVPKICPHCNGRGEIVGLPD
jgi:DnaJ-class molecular chaperone